MKSLRRHGWTHDVELCSLIYLEQRVYFIAKAVLFKKNKRKTNLWHIIFYITELQISDIYKLNLYCKGKEDECSYFKYETNVSKLREENRDRLFFFFFFALEQNSILGS